MTADRLLLLVIFVLFIILSYYLVKSYIDISKGNASNLTWLLAIVLTLIFSIGIHQRVTITHADEEMVIKQSESLFAEKVKGWKVPGILLKRAGDVCDNILHDLSVVGKSDKQIKLYVDFYRINYCIGYTPISISWNNL